MPLDTDNDLLIVNDSITPAGGEVTHLTGTVTTRAGDAAAQRVRTGTRTACTRTRLTGSGVTSDPVGAGSCGPKGNSHPLSGRTGRTLTCQGARRRHAAQPGQRTEAVRQDHAVLGGEDVGGDGPPDGQDPFEVAAHAHVAVVPRHRLGRHEVVHRWRGPRPR